MLKGKQLKQNRLTGMIKIKVVSRADFSDNLICQKPELAWYNFLPLVAVLGFVQQMEEYDDHYTHFYWV